MGKWSDASQRNLYEEKKNWNTRQVIKPNPSRYVTNLKQDKPSLNPLGNLEMCSFLMSQVQFQLLTTWMS